MPIQELLARVESEYEALQSKYDDALVEVGFLRTCLAASKPLDFAIDGLGGDVEAAQPMQQFSIEALHGAPPHVAPPVHSSTAVKGGGATRASQGGMTKASEGTPLRPSSFTSGKMARRVSTDSGSMSKNTTYLNVGGSTSYQDNTLPEGNSLSARSTRFLANPCVEGLLVLIVLSNVVVLVFETDMRAAQKPKLMALEVLGWVYLLIYIGEFALRVIAFGSHVFDDKWTRLDFVVIVVDGVTMLIKQLMSDKLTISASMLRLLRCFRLVRVFKVLRFVKELQLLIHGFSGAMKAVCWATGMLEIMVSIWSLIYVEVLYPRVVEMLDSEKMEPCYRCDMAYSSFWNAHMTIWQQVIAGDSWGKISADVMTEFPWTAVIYIGCLMTTQFAMLNLIFTVIVDAAIRTREEDAQQKLADKEASFRGMRNKLVRLCQDMDTDASGELTLDELVSGYENNMDFADTMAGLDITLDDIATLFMIMDEDRSGEVSYMEFVNNIYKIKEQDVHTMLMFVKGYVIDLRFKMKEDITSLLKETLRQSVSTSEKMQQMMNRVEDLFAASRGSEGGKQHLEAMVQQVEDLVAGTQNASGHRHMEAMVRHVEDLVAGTQNASGRRHMEAMVKHVENLVAGTQSANSHQHVEEMVKHVKEHVKDLVTGTQSAGSQQQMEEMVKRVEDLVAGTQNASSQQQMEEMVKRIEDLVASTQSANSQQHMEAMVRHVESLVAGTRSANTKEKEATTPSSSAPKFSLPPLHPT